MTKAEQFRKAVDFLEEYVSASNALYDNNPELVGFESRLQFAIKILKESEGYEGFTQWAIALYRNDKLLKLAKDCNQCQLCGGHGGDTIVAAHSNQLRDGKGRGLKSHDYRVAFICFTCHFSLDQGHLLSRDERIEKWEEAHRKTIGWLFENDHIKIIWQTEKSMIQWFYT